MLRVVDQVLFADVEEMAKKLRAASSLAVTDEGPKFSCCCGKCVSRSLVINDSPITSMDLGVAAHLLEVLLSHARRSSG